MSIELPDWLRGTLLLGRDGAGNIIPILIDAAGQINVLLRGADALGTVHTVRTDAAGQLYAILRGAGGNDVSVDATGQLTAILKGLYGGVYTPLSVDVSGRIQAFMLDSEDQWGQTLKTGNSDLAARLGAMKTYDWRGSVIYQTDFSHGCTADNQAVAGAGAAISLDIEHWETSGYYLKLVGGSNGAGTATWYLQKGTPPMARGGMEVAFSFNTSLLNFSLILALNDATNLLYCGVRVDTVANQLQYYNNVGAWVNFAAIAPGWFSGTFYPLKFVVDWSTRRYVRCMFNRVQYDLSALGIRVFAPTGIPYTLAQAVAGSRPTFNDPCWLDKVVLTVNEP